MEEYLLGIEAEPLRAEDALVHFQNVLRERPEEFWGHYGVAAAAYRLADPATAAAHLEYCIALRPENATLRTKLAGRLYDMHRLDEALEQCNQALMLDPDDAESYRTRTFLWNRLGQDERFRADIERYELLTRHLGKLPGWRLRLDWMRLRSPDGAEVLDRDPTGRSLYERVLTADPEDVDLRYAQAVQLQNRGDLQAALDHYNRILDIEPDHLKARYGAARCFTNGTTAQQQATSPTSLNIRGTKSWFGGRARCSRPSTARPRSFSTREPLTRPCRWPGAGLPMPDGFMTSRSRVGCTTRWRAPMRSRRDRPRNNSRRPQLISTWPRNIAASFSDRRGS